MIMSAIYNIYIYIFIYLFIYLFSIYIIRCIHLIYRVHVHYIDIIYTYRHVIYTPIYV